MVYASENSILWFQNRLILWESGERKIGPHFNNKAHLFRFFSGLIYKGTVPIDTSYIYKAILFKKHSFYISFLIFSI